jgi:hypothetical protein
MAKEWILNQAMNRWGINKKNSVGPVSELVRKCAPKTLEEWKTYYFQNVFSEAYLEELGKKLFVKVTEVIQFEVAEVTEQNCVNYIKHVVINRTFQGYQTEIETIYGQLQGQIDYPIKPAPDEWDRLYNVDFYIEVKGKYIGIQIKPVTFEHTFEDYKWKEMQEKTHQKFTKKFGGKVFIIFSAKVGGKKEIINKDVIQHIKDEIKRLENS